jgi:hypothetical protein
MDFIEKIFHISPDQGSGSFEVLLILVLLGSLAVFLFWRTKIGKRKRP